MDDLKYLELTKKEIQETAIVEAEEIIESGAIDSINAYMLAMAKAEYYSNLAKGFHDQAMQDFEDYGEKEVELFGRKISKFEAGVKYDFSKCGHLELEALERVKKSTEARIKGFKDQIKYIQEPQTMVNDDGEVFEVKPPTKTSTTKLKLIY